MKCMTREGKITFPILFSDWRTVQGKFVILTFCSMLVSITVIAFPRIQIIFTRHLDLIREILIWHVNRHLFVNKGHLALIDYFKIWECVEVILKGIVQDHWSTVI